MFRSLTLLAAAVVLLSAVSSPAQDVVLSQLYGSGVHAFFSRDYVKAHELLTSAIDGGTKDPRPYYFRGLTLQKLGREEQAEEDFEQGADLESRDIDRLYNVGRSLERIHGQVRLQLEEYRMKARLAARQRAEKLYQQRYGTEPAPGIGVPPSPLEGVGDLPTDVAAEPPVEPPSDFPPGMGPIEEGPAQPAVGPPALPEPGSPFTEEPPAAPATPPTDDPFAIPGAGPAGPPEAPAEPPLGTPVEDPLGSGTVGDTPAGPGTPEPTPPADDPFGGLGPLNDIGPEPPVTPPADTPAPPADTPAPPADDPFGGLGAPAVTPPATPPAAPDAGTPAPPAAETPAPPADDPFGGLGAPAVTPPAAGTPATPAKAQAGSNDDPFGGLSPTPPAKAPGSARTRRRPPCRPLVPPPIRSGNSRCSLVSSVVVLPTSCQTGATW